MTGRFTDWAVLRDLTDRGSRLWLSKVKSPPPAPYPVCPEKYSKSVDERLPHWRPEPTHYSSPSHTSAKQSAAPVEEHCPEEEKCDQVSQPTAIRLPGGQLELPLTPHVTLSRPSTPGHTNATARAAGTTTEAGDASCFSQHRQPSLKRHCASSVLEELGAMTDPDYSGPSSWSSVPVPSFTERRWKIRPQLLAVAGSCLVMVASGFSLSYHAPINDQHAVSSAERRRHHLLAVGCLLGSLVACPLLSAGRRRPALALSASQVVVWLLSMFGTSRWLATTSEVLTGALSCANTLTALLYVAEISVVECRGSFLASALASFDLGLLLCVALGSAVNFGPITPTDQLAMNGARLLAGLGLCLTLLAGGTVLLGWPESPRHLVAVDSNKVGAEISLRLLRGFDHYSECELNVILTNITEEDNRGVVIGAEFFIGGWRNLIATVQQTVSRWLHVHVRRPCLSTGLLSSVLLLLLPLCGFGTVTALALGLVAEHGSATRRATLAAIAALKTATTAVTAGSGVLDQWGRRRPLLVATALQASALAVLAVVALVIQTQSSSSSSGGGTSGATEGRVTLALLLLLVAMYSSAAGVGMSTVPWLLAAELPPQHSRPLVASIAAFSYWTGDLVSTYLVLVVHESLGAAGVLWMHFLGSTVCYFVIFLLVPETKNRALEEIEVYFSNGFGKDVKARVPSVMLTKF